MTDGATADAGGMDPDELALFADAVRRATSSSTGADLDAALDALGWSDALAVDPRAATATLFEAQGGSGATSGALGRVVMAALGIDTPRDAAVLLPAPGRDDPPATWIDPDHAGRIDGIGGADLTRASSVVLVRRSDGATATATVPVSGLRTTPITGIDPAAEMVRVTTGELPGVGDWTATPRDWSEAVAAARRALAHEQVGAMRSMLRLARGHALERVQFGRPIARFQAVRHRLADSLVAIEAADAALDGAWLDGSPLTAAVAKAVAGTSARTVRRHCQQVLAGIGFTTEHDLHLFIRRSLVLDALFGDAAALNDRIGATLIAEGGLPDLLPL